jgi:PAS domain S-box-containing protein
MVSVLCEQGQRPAALRLEQLWNKLAQLHSFSLLCAYPMRSFSEENDGKPFHDVCSAHSHVCLAESFTLPTGQDQLRRTIAILQQQAKALECEVARRKAIEKALHQREQELSDFLENAVEGMHRLGPDGKILWANKAELELLGYEKDEYIGLHVADFHIDRAAVQDILEKLRHGVTLYNYPAKIRCKDGSVKHVLMHSNAIVENGKLISTRCQTRDVTDRVHLEEKLNQRLRELADLHHRKDEFLAMLGHELHSLLAPVRTSLESMRTHNQDKTQIARSRDTIARHITHMTRLVDDLVQLQGGSVKACSKGSGKGGESTVTLPLQRTAEAREANSRNEGCAQDHRPSVERTILIVDDNADAAESLGEYLRTCGHSIYISYDGPSAITAASRIHPDVIILDIGLPTMNGYQVAQHLRSDEDLRSSLLVALTGYAQEGDRASAQAAGFDYHLAKPLDIKKLTTLLAEMK